MIIVGSVLAVLVILYACSVEILWDRDWIYRKAMNVSGTAGPVEGNGAEHTAPMIKKRWLHSHNDEMQGSKALTLALSHGYGSIEADVWLAAYDQSGHAEGRALSHEPGAASRVPESRHWLPVPEIIDETERKRLLSIAPRRQPGTGDQAGTSAVPQHEDPRGAPSPQQAHAPSAGIQSREAVSAPTLTVGHEEHEISGTFKDIYLDPLLKILDENNKGRDVRAGDWVGLYKDDPKAEVQILVDMKSDGYATWPYLDAAVEPFRAKGYLTTYDPASSKWTYGPLVMVCGGSAPIAGTYYSSPRDLFHDAPLIKLKEPLSIPASEHGPAITTEWTSDLAPMASSKLPIQYNLGIALPPLQAAQTLTEFTSEARKRGIKSRWWGFAKSPRWLRWRIYQLLKDGGVDWILGDDLDDTAAWDDEQQQQQQQQQKPPPPTK
ncbi:hypothetical protein BD324DRAFT_622526 [Kockovaella imperatae]|uniref:Uncharacterized protein n=1 Tax=Kockovaella imperatae TaxID=4999 RepID=A0A1Y1UHR7_9TREE|nr:hypothetical protein BD324DRAFT_622526 [Kockovaella imperatae]ORX37588.1 hypothetical protein BD324DRAFT_622526 [Kockovaella imperatae]